MLIKVFYFGLGLVDILAELFNQLVEKGENRLRGKDADSFDDGSLVFIKANPDQGKAEDLTVIKGIGPTFAARLMDAGITNYRSLAGLSADQLKEITHVANWQGDPQEWINQAKSFANSH